MSAPVNDDYHEILLALVAERARFLVVGAHALAVHGLPRATVDIDIWIDRTDRASGKVKGTPRLIADGAGAGRMVSAYDVARNGLLVVRRGALGTQRELVVVERNGAERSVLAEPKPYRSPRFSPDGKQITYTAAQTATPGG